MINVPIHPDEYTRVGRTVTFSANVIDGEQVIAYYSVQDPGEATHRHRTELKDAWANPPIWTLDEEPSGLELMFFWTPTPGLTLWVVRDAGVNAELRRMRIDATTGAFLAWDITGQMFGKTGLVVTAWATTTADSELAYVAEVSTGRARLWRYYHGDWDEVYSIGVTGVVGINSIWIGEDAVYLTIGDYTSPSIHTLETMQAVYKATDGITFAETATQPNYGGGVLGTDYPGPYQVFEFLGYLYCIHNNNDVSGGGINKVAGSYFSISGDGGASWSNGDAMMNFSLQCEYIGGTYANGFRIIWASQLANTQSVWKGTSLVQNQTGYANRPLGGHFPSDDINALFLTEEAAFDKKSSTPNNYSSWPNAGTTGWGVPIAGHRAGITFQNDAEWVAAIQATGANIGKIKLSLDTGATWVDLQPSPLNSDVRAIEFGRGSSGCLVPTGTGGN